MQNSVTALSRYPAQKWKWIMLCHLIICSLGLVKLSMFVGGLLYETSFAELAIAKLGTVGLENSVNKLGRFIQYFVGMLLLPLFYIFAFYTFTREHNHSTSYFSKPIRLKIYFLINILFTVILLFSKLKSLTWIPIWTLLTFSLPFSYLGVTLAKIPTMPKWLAWSVFACLLLQYACIFQPLISKPLRISSEFINIPGQTQLNSGEWVDNIQFINQHHIGDSVRYDPRSDLGNTPAPLPGTYVKINDASQLIPFLDANEEDNKYRYTYYPTSHVLAIKGPMSEKEQRLLKLALPNADDKKQIDTLYILSINQKNLNLNRIYTPIEWEFIQKNKIELADQIRVGWFFHHHNYFFTPLFSVTQGDHSFQPIMVYGWFSTLLFAKLLPLVGGINYQSYFKILFAFYPLYLICFAGLLLILFKRVEYLILGLILSISAIFNIGIQTLQLGIGFNPFRHFLDVFVLGSFYLYIARQKLVWLAISLSLALMATLINKEFGIFLLGAVSISVFAQELVQKRWFSKAVLLTLFASCIGIYLYLLKIPGSDPNSIYNILGEGAPKTSSSLVRSVLFFNLFLYVAFLAFQTLKNKMNYFWLAIIFYCQFLLVYFLWYPYPHHLYGIAAPFILLGLCFIFMTIHLFKKQNVEKPILLSLISILVVFVYLPSAFSYYTDNYKYNMTFKTHKLYEWPFATAKIISTMDPSLFKKSADLIQHYAHSPQIYILSKYENILPVLAGKYNGMPFPELMTNLITANDVQQVVALITQKKPTYLFVDTDIERSFNNEVYDEYDPMVKKLQLHDLGRPHVLNRLATVFKAIKSDYHPLASSELITVYERNNHAS